jgi:hypothetical protein
MKNAAGDILTSTGPFYNSPKVMSRITEVIMLGNAKAVKQESTNREFLQLMSNANTISENFAA